MTHFQFYKNNKYNIKLIDKKPPIFIKNGEKKLKN